MQSLIENPLINLLTTHQILDLKHLEPFHDKVRDMDGIKVLRDRTTGLVVLDKINHISFEYYENNVNYTTGRDMVHTKSGTITTKFLDDNLRRVKMYGPYFKGKSILDFGCGRGEFVLMLHKKKHEVYGLEPNKWNREYIEGKGVKCFSSIETLEPHRKFDYIVLNHVFHHLTDPLTILKQLKKHLKKDGAIILEVRHGNDFLINSLNDGSFRDFTFCSEHLILHTHDSLLKLCKAGGFKNTSVHYYQRFPLSNHIHWFLQRKPGGHAILDYFNTPQLVKQYAKVITNRKETDTLIAILPNGNPTGIENCFKLK
jgi:SAM-dependent methyltransferase